MSLTNCTSSHIPQLSNLIRGLLRGTDACVLPTKSQTKVLFLYGMRRVLMLKRYSAYGGSHNRMARRRRKIWTFYGSNMKISLDFDAIWHLEHSF